MGDVFEQVLLPVESFQVGRGQVLLHHAVAVAVTEVDLLDMLHNQVVTNLLEAKNRVENGVAGRVITT